MASAVRIAAAWLISLGPIALVIAAVVGLVVVVVKNWDTIREKTRALWEAVKRLTSDAWDAVKGSVSGAVEAIKGLTRDAWDTVKSLTRGAWGAVKGFVSGGVEAVKGFVSGAWNTVKGLTRDAWNAVKGIVRDAWEALKGAVSGGIAAVVGFVRDLPGKAVAALSSLGGKLATTASEAWAKFRTAQREVIVRIITYARDLPGKIVTAVGDLSRKLYSAGGDLLRGLANGITGAVGDVVEAARRAAKAAVDGVKDFLGIASPSKVFAVLGQQSGAGLVQGLERSRRSVAQAAGDLVDLAGVKVGGSAYVGARMSATSRTAPAERAPRLGGDSALLQAIRENTAETRAMREDLRRMPRDYRLGERSRTGA